MKKIITRLTTIDDFQDLRTLCIDTFAATYQHKNTVKNFEHYIATAFNEQQLLKELENPNSYFYFFYLEKELIGYLKLNIGDAQTEKHPDDYLEIERIYLRKSHQGKGIGGQMITYTLECAKALNKPIVWLGVWSKNTAAIRFYEQQGFRKYAEHAFVLGDEEQVDFLLRRKC